MSKAVVGPIIVEIQGEASGLNNQIAAMQMKATNAFKKIGGAASGMITGAAVTFIAALAVGLTAGVKASIDFEKAFANVRKTLNATDAELKIVAADLLEISKSLPQNASELANIAAVAGQLGIAAADVAQFTEVIAKLGGASNLVGEEGATSMARFMKVINASIDNTEAYASVLVELGNNMAATESEIIELAKNFGALGTQVGLSGDEILAFSAAMREMGQPAAAGATALNKLFTALNLAALGEGGLKEFADIAGMSMTEFKELTEESMAAAAAAVLSGLNAMGENSESQIKALDSVGLARDRVARALITLAANEEGLAKARRLAAEELLEQNALQEEFTKKQDTAAGQMEILKSKFYSFAVTMGQIFLPAIKALVKFLSRLLDGIIFITSAFKEATSSVKVFTGIVVGNRLVATILKLSDGFKGLAARIATSVDGIDAMGKKLGWFAKMAKKIGLGRLIGFLSGIGIALEGFNFFGKMQEDIDVFNGAVDSLTKKFNILKQEGDGLGEMTTDEFRKMVEGLEDSEIRETLLNEIDLGNLTAEEAARIANSGGAIGKEVMQGLRDQLGVGRAGRNIGTDIAAMKKIKEQMEAQGRTNNEIYETTSELYQQLSDNNGVHNETTRLLEAQLIAYLAIVDAGSESVTLEQKLRNLLVANADEIGKTPMEIRAATREMDDLAAFAKAFGMEISGVPALIDILFPKEKDPVQVAIQNFKEDLADLAEMVNSVFAPEAAKFELQFAEMDEAEAKEEVVKLTQEQVDLTKELVSNSQDLAKLKASELLTEEEKLDIAEKRAELSELEAKHALDTLLTIEETKEQQELINEALEIEERIRNGFSLSANDQLRREKLRKDRRRVELAAAQGSLEFADLELAAIDENIKNIEDKALTQEEADEKRRIASEINQNAEKRRAEELNTILKLKSQILETQETATARRQEEIEKIEKRRIEINERLKELPRDIAEGHYSILKAQKNVVDKTIEMKKAFIDLSRVSQEEMQKLAASIGIPASMISNLLGLTDLNDIESKNLLNSLLGKTTSKANQIQQMGKYSARHMGGMFKPRENVLVGELGPELIKAFPGGGGMVTPLGNRGDGQSGGNIVNINVTGLPTDPIAARRIAQNIQRELNKLSSDGRSGVVR